MARCEIGIQTSEGEAMNRHERRKTAVFEKTTITRADIAAAARICAWDGCLASFHHNKEIEYLPKGWTILLVFRAKKPPPSDMQRDAVLCPAHTAALERQLKQLSSNDLDRPQGSARALNQTRYQKRSARPAADFCRRPATGSVRSAVASSQPQIDEAFACSPA